MSTQLYNMERESGPRQLLEDVPPSSVGLSAQGKAADPASMNSYPEGGTRAWLVAVGAAGSMFCSFGYANAFGVFQEYYQTHQLRGQSPSAISWIGSLQVFFLLAGTLVGGPLFDQYGGKVAWPPAATLIVSVMMTSLSTSYYQFLLAQGILGGLSMGMMMAPAIAAASQYFQKKRGASMGVVVGGSSIGGVIWPIALSRMLYNPHMGFATTVRICGFIMIPILGICCVFIRARLPPRKGTFFIPAAFTQLPFVFLILAVFLMLLGMYTPFFYLPSFATAHGMNNRLANYLIAILNGSSFFGRVIPGILADKLGALNMLCLAGVSTGVLIEIWPYTSSTGSIVAFSALYGFCSGAIISLMSVSFARMSKDPRNIGTYIGMGMAVVSLAALTGAPISGALVARYHSFNQASIASGIFVMIGGIIVLLVKHFSHGGIFANI